MSLSSSVNPADTQWKVLVQIDVQYGELLRIKTYKGHIGLCDGIGDSTTRLMLEQILTDEEDHADTWETVLAKRPK